MSSTFPHMSMLSTSLSHSSYTQQSNLEALIAKSIQNHSHLSDQHPQEVGAEVNDSPSRPKAKRHPTTVPEGDSDEEYEETSRTGAARRRAQEEEESGNVATETTGLLSDRGRRRSGLRASISSALSHRDQSRLSRLTTITGGHPHDDVCEDSALWEDDTASEAPHPADLERSRTYSHASRTSRRSQLLASGRLGGFTPHDITAQAEHLGGARFAEPNHAEEDLLRAEESANHMFVDPAEVLDPHEDLQLPVDDRGKVIEDWRKSIGPEFRILASSALPVFFTQVAEYSLVLASVISIGHLGTTDLAASSLGSMTSSVTCFAILQGMASALDTLLPAAWTSDDPTRVGLWTQRMVIVCSVALLPMYFVWWNAEGLLLLLRQEPPVAERAALYLRYLSVGIPGYMVNIIMRKYFQSQNLMSAPTIVIAIVAPLNAILNWLLVWGPKPIRLGFVGAPLATAISFNAAAIVSFSYAAFIAPKTAWGGFSRDAFSKLGTVTSLGLAGTIMVCSEWFAWEAIALATSLLGPVALAAQSILLSTSSVLFQVPQAMGIATAVRVGNLLGAGRPFEARLAAMLAIGLAVCTSMLNSTLLMIFRKQIALLFNTDPAVVDLVTELAFYAAAFQMADGVVGASGGTLRAVGKQSAGALINLTAYYVFGLPLGIWLCFNGGFGIKGIWSGLSFSLFYAAVFIIVIITRLDWSKAVVRARTRLGLSPWPEEGKEEDVPNYGATMGGH